MGENLMRAMDQVDTMAEEMKGKLPSSAISEMRADLHANWGGPEQVYLPMEVKEAVEKMRKHDEL
jgi:hypothetical protein